MGAGSKVVRSTIGFALVGLWLFCAPSSGAADYTERKIIVKAGDTLGGIAARENVPVEDLRRWNRKRIGAEDRIRAGDELVVRVPKTPVEPPPDGETPHKTYRALYQIRPGDTLSQIARRLEISVEDLMVWNDLKSEAAIQAGKALVYERAGDRPSAQSRGRPAGGKLIDGVHLGRGKGYRLRFPENAWGLPRLKQVLRRCAKHVHLRFPGTADLLVGDLSRPNGGRFPPHQSHQSGRDADIGYYLKGNVQNTTMHRVVQGDLDYAKNWSFLRCLLRYDRVVRVYMDSAIQRGYVAYLEERQLVDAETLGRLFEASGGKKALIRHAPEHDTHLHVRIACDPEDAGCSEESDDQGFEL
jgi:murein endopeptidase